MMEFGAARARLALAWRFGLAAVARPTRLALAWRFGLGG
jgi:hypothetical protein